ncbi:AGAP011006-PA-like protein [Anopheles sinensis]|uniref:AGAP011006-PA-like protein n=1 Tax=Anopheles sinensis TaxID=74873 RepID=A0A084W978_ANOSI|nr:AGAP011006-PA-like protein [Anopheles sinensis]
MSRILLFIIILSIPSTVVYAVMSKMTIALTKAEVVSDQKYLNASVRISRFTTEPYFTFDMTFVVLQKLNDLSLQVRHLVWLAGRENVFFDVTVDLCSFYKRPNHSILKLVFEEIKKHGPVPTSCPIFPKRFVYSNISLNKIRIPPYIPETRFQMVINAWTGSKQGNVVIYEGRWFGRLKKIVRSNE